MRNDLIPETTGAVGVKAYVAGLSPLFYDMSKVLGSRTPVVVAGVLALSFLLLMAVFRSVLVPLTATLGFLLSVLATLGVTVAVFQEGLFGLVEGHLLGGGTLVRVFDTLLRLGEALPGGIHRRRQRVLVRSLRPRELRLCGILRIRGLSLGARELIPLAF